MPIIIRSSPKEHRRSTQSVPSEDNDDSEDDTEKLTHRPNSKVPEVDGFDNHDEFTRWLLVNIILHTLFMTGAKLN